MKFFTYKNRFCKDNDQYSISIAPIGSDTNNISQGVKVSYMCIPCFIIKISNNIMEKVTMKEINLLMRTR